MKLRSPLIPLMSIFCLSLSALGCEESSSEKGSDEETTLSRDVSSAGADDDAADADDADDTDAVADADASDDSAQALLALAEALGAEQEGESEELAALKDLASTLAASQEPDSECSAGEYGADCEPCPAGLWCQASGAIVACASGQYCPEGTTTPEVCAAGSYCATPSTTPIACAAGEYCAAGSSAPIACAAGEYCAAGSSAPVACAAGEYCAAGSSAPVACAAGSYCATPSTTPIACAAGEYCAAGSSAPVACAAGEYCAAGSSAPVACSAGTWDGDADASTPCVSWSECTVGQEETVAPSSREDRVCVDFSWTKQFGTMGADFAYSVTTDASGNVYVSGYTGGDLEGSNLGGVDAYVRKLNAAGEEQWTKQFGTTSDDYANSVTTDASGNVYVSGYTQGSLDGSNLGGRDEYVRKLNAAGEEVWTKQFGTTRDDYANSVTTDASGNVYVSGYTFGDLDGSILYGSDAYVRKLNAAGEEQWRKQFGTVGNDYAYSVATDASGNVYVSGSTFGSLEGSNQGFSDAYVRKLNAAGEEVWTKQFGTVRTDTANSVATDVSGNVYVSGYTRGDLEGSNLGGRDAYVRKLNSAGEERWTKQFGTVSSDYANSVTTDASGNVYVSGYTQGSLDGSNQGGFDAYVRKLNAAGQKQWTKQFGTTNNDRARSVATDASGNVYVSGYTEGDLYGDNAGEEDSFVRRIVPDDID